MKNQYIQYYIYQYMSISIYEHFELSSPSAQAFCSYLSYFAAAIVEALKIDCYFYTDISADWNGILLEKREKFLTAGYVDFTVPMCDTKFV